MAKNTTTRWDALSMRDRASLIKLYSQSGIRKLGDMRAHYNKFGEGGDKDTVKKLAYKIGAYAHEGAGITPFGILDALTSKQKEYNELKAFIYGPETVGFTEYTGTSNKPKFSKNTKVYNGILNPNNEYVFPENMKGFLEEVASRKGNIYLNADLMPGHEKQRYDAANYPVNLQFDENGNIFGNAADLYDFDPDYNTRYRDGYKWQAKLMSKQGIPYTVRQDNIPFRFVNDEQDIDAAKTLGSFSYGELGTNADVSNAAIINVMERLGNGTIAPSVVKAGLPAYDEYYRDDYYSNGGKIHIKPENNGGLLHRFDMGGDKEKQPWWIRASLGAMMADAPAVTTASGWTYDSNGNIVQTEQDSEGAKKLRENLTEIAMMPMMDFAGEAIGSAIAGTKAYKTYKLAKELKSAVKNNDLVEPIVNASKVSPASKVGTSGKLFYEPSFQYTFDDISHIPEPSGIGYTGYTPTAQSKVGQQFVEDVNEAANWALQRGRVRPTQHQIFDFTDVDHIGGGAESRVYNDPNNPDRVLKVRWAQKGSDTPEEAIAEGLKVLKKENFPIYEMPLSIDGATKLQYGDKYLWYPVYSQERLRMLPDVPSSPEAAEALKQMTDRFANRIGTIPYHKWDADYAPINNIFFEDYYRPGAGAKDFKPENMGFSRNGTLMGIDLHKYGGKIHIKPENRGKFNALLKRTGKSASWFKAHGTPLQRKRATFALNARKWKHENGGFLDINTKFFNV